MLHLELTDLVREALDHRATCTWCATHSTGPKVECLGASAVLLAAVDSAAVAVTA